MADSKGVPALNGKGLGTRRSQTLKIVDQFGGGQHEHHSDPRALAQRSAREIMCAQRDVQALASAQEWAAQASKQAIRARAAEYREQSIALACAASALPERQAEPLLELAASFTRRSAVILREVADV